MTRRNLRYVLAYLIYLMLMVLFLVFYAPESSLLKTLDWQLFSYLNRRAELPELDNKALW